MIAGAVGNRGSLRRRRTVIRQPLQRGVYLFLVDGLILNVVEKQLRKQGAKRLCRRIITVCGQRDRLPSGDFSCAAGMQISSATLLRSVSRVNSMPGLQTIMLPVVSV